MMCNVNAKITLRFSMFNVDVVLPKSKQSTRRETHGKWNGLRVGGAGNIENLFMEMTHHEWTT